MRNLGENDFLNTYLALGAEELDRFLKMPRKVQEIFFSIVLMYQNGKLKKDSQGNLQNMQLETFMPSCDCDGSPIEMIFDLAFQTYVLKETEYKNNRYYFLEDQHEIQIGDKHYIVDFFNEEANLIIECDGHDFHEKTKEQVAKDNEREYDLKMAGYNILRFSGSQIYNRPFECAEEAYLYIAKLIQKEERSRQHELHKRNKSFL